jgi:hypothetical protein
MREEAKILEDLRGQIDKIQQREASIISKDKLTILPSKRIHKDIRRRTKTHFTSNRSKKQAKQRQFNRKRYRGFKVAAMLGKKKTLIVNP